MILDLAVQGADWTLWQAVQGADWTPSCAGDTPGHLHVTLTHLDGSVQGKYLDSSFTVPGEYSAGTVPGQCSAKTEHGQCCDST